MEEDFFLQLTSWWGLSDKPGQKKMFVKDDGTYLIKLEHYLSADFNDNRRVERKFSEKRLADIKMKLKKIIVKNEEKRMLDMGYTIEFNGVKVINDFDLWQKVMEIIPEFNSEL